MVRTLSSNTGSAGLIPGLGAKIHHASWPEKPPQHKQHKPQKQYCNKFNKDFKNDPHQNKNLEKKKKNKRLYLALIFP